jgi:hypothetical protein
MQHTRTEQITNSLLLHATEEDKTEMACNRPRTDAKYIKMMGKFQMMRPL